MPYPADMEKLSLRMFPTVRQPSLAGNGMRSLSNRLNHVTVNKNLYHLSHASRFTPVDPLLPSLETSKPTPFLPCRRGKSHNDVNAPLSGFINLSVAKLPRLGNGVRQSAQLVTAVNKFKVQRLEVRPSGRFGFGVRQVKGRARVEG